MALEKLVKVDRVEVLESGEVQVRTRTSIVEDGQQISANFHRHIVAPGDDYSKEEAHVQAICKAVQTPAVVAAYQAAMAAQGV
jgi:hypothetical protein